MQDDTQREKCNRPIHVQGMLNARPHIWRKMQQTYSVQMTQRSTKVLKARVDNSVQKGNEKHDGDGVEGV